MIKIDLPIYKTYIKVYVTDDFKGVTKKLGFEFDNLDDYGGFQFVHEGIQYIFTTSEISHGDLAHECLHVAKSVLRGIGLTLSDHTEEAETYLMGYIIDEYYRKVKPRSSGKR